MIVLHGDHDIASRQELLDQKTKGRASGLNIQELSGTDLTLDQLVQLLSSQTLLGQTNLVIVTNFFSRRPGQDKKKILQYLLSDNPGGLIIWESKDVSAQLVSLPASSIKKFDLPKYIFSFLDSFSLESLQKTLASAVPEQIFASLVRRLHDLILVKSGYSSGSPGRASFLSRQANRYSWEKLISLQSRLLEIDLAQKTSSSPYDLGAALELWAIFALS